MTIKVKTETQEEKEALDMIDNTPAQFVNCTAKHSNELLNTLNWFKRAIPNPTDEQKCIQIGCHFEEVSEMARAIGDYDLESEVSIAADEYKEVVDFIPDSDIDKLELADSIADQIVTAVGTAYMYGIDILGALAEVNRSNYSKFENGQPVFDENGKITKGKHYTPPNLTGMIGK